LAALSGISVYGQDNTPTIVPADTTLSAPIDTLAADSVGMPQDSIQADSTSDGLKSMVTIAAADSQVTELKTNIIHLYGDAKVKYEGFELAADYIRVDQTKNEVFASGVVDHNGKFAGRPVVIFPNEPPKAVDSLRYNFDTGNGVTFGIFTEVDGGFIQASRVRKNQYNEMSLYHGLYSTCNLPQPHTHFGIQISKGIVTENQIISGPAY